MSMIAYLMRYLFVILTILIVWPLLRLATLQLRSAMRRRALPVEGFFLLAETGRDISAKDPQQSSIRSLPLFPTTFIGRSKTCDIRLHQDEIARRSALLYLYDGRWFIRPAQPKKELSLNGEVLKTPVLLHDRDQLVIGGIRFTFIDDRKPKDINEPVKADSEAIPPPIPTAGALRLSQQAANLYALAGSLLLIFLIDSALLELRLIVSVFCLGLFLLYNLFVWLLKITLPQLDRLILPVLQFLLFTGILLQVRLALQPMTAEAITTDPGLLSEQIMRDLLPQGLSIVIGLILLPVLANLIAKSRLLEALGLISVIITPLLFVITLVLGHGAQTHGATLWIEVGGQSIQPSELAKITYVIVLASFFKHQPPLKTQVYFGLWAAGVFFLILLLPDLGSAMVLLPTTLLVYVVMTSAYGKAGLLLAGSGVLSVIAYTFFPHVQRRLLGWTTLWDEVSDFNRQIVYGLQAIARGGLLGRGLGNGSPGGIPLASSDMVFAILGEEFGLLVGMALVVAFMVVWLISARLALKARDGFSASLALAVGSLLFIQAVVVITGVTGLLPLTGKTIPLLARGGSSIVSVFILFALLIGLSGRKQEVKPQ